MKFPQTLRLRGCEGVSVPDLAALDAGISRYVGKPGVEVQALNALSLSHYRKCVLKGELACADAATAELLSVPFDAPKTPKLTAPKEG